MKWKDVDFSTGSISVQRTKVQINGLGDLEKEPKTAASRRRIPLGNSHKVILMLAGWKANQEQRLASGLLEVSQEHFIFSDTGESPWTQARIQKNFVKIRKEADIKVKIHELRHTHASLSLATGEGIDTVMRRMGHSNVSTTIDTYSHAIAGSQEQALESFTEALEGKPVTS